MFVKKGLIKNARLIIHRLHHRFIPSSHHQQSHRSHFGEPIGYSPSTDPLRIFSAQLFMDRLLTSIPALARVRLVASLSMAA